MSRIFGRGRRVWNAESLIAERSLARKGAVNVTTTKALTHSAVWACRRLRADLISTSPIDVYRQSKLGRVDLPTPPILVTPDGTIDITEWMYSTQADLDSMGNAFGLIRAVNAYKLPALIELVPAESVVVRVKDGKLFKYVIGGKDYDPSEVWHERQFTTSGSLVGLSPLANAAASIGQYLSAQEFSLDWFRAGGRPGARLWNKSKIIKRTEADEVKDRFKSSVQNGDLFVHGADWDYEMIGAKASETEFINSMKFGIGDICRFLGVPGDMIDAESSTGAITYANVTQRNLQLLIMNIGPSVVRRERALSRLLPSPQYVKLNTDAAVLRMDPITRANMNQTLLISKQRTVTEVREKDDLLPYTPEQIDEINQFTPAKATTPSQTGATA